MSLLWMEYETEFEHLVENGDHAQYHPDDGRNHSGREQTGRRSHFEVILPIELDKTADRSIRSRMEVIDTVSMIGPYMNEVLPPTPPKRKQQPIDIPDLYTFFFTQ